jgi:hypothetical protein
VVYFVRGGDAVKIGRTGNLAARLKALATASAVPLEVLAALPGGRDLEVQLHRRWQHLRLKGEWFRATPDLLADIRERVARAAEPPPEPRHWVRLGRVLRALGSGGLGQP